MRLRRSLRLILSLFFLPLSVGAAADSPGEINFTLENSRQAITSVELEQWARSRNLRLQADSSLRNLADSVAAVVPEQGLSFELESPARGRIYLYLDLASYEPLAGAQHPRVRWLEVWVNNHLATTLYQGGGRYLDQPTVVVIDREMVLDGRLRIRLRPSPGDGIFAIWDAFVSRYDERTTEATP
ncbi:MAG: hypothetical protein K1X75_14805 [Leptospirales bacterium]|nr:hypothetical protein [Leptospirales bacterium]